MYKLVAIDLDGTLLDSYGQISDRNKNAIKNAINKGTKIVLASGRGAMSVQNFGNEIGANEYAICGNGAMIYEFDTENSIIAKSLNYNVMFYNHENANKPDNKKTNIYLTNDVYNYVLNRKEVDYTKITVCDDNNIIFNSIIKKLRSIKEIDVLDVGHMTRKLMKMGTDVYSIEYYYTEITNENTTKWNAIEFLIEKLGIKKEEVIAIGDNVNDQTMLENAGLGVAMANSAPYIQQMGKIVTDSNNEDGVAKVIEKYILSE